jgi:hypothetical protein
MVVEVYIVNIFKASGPEYKILCQRGPLSLFLYSSLFCNYTVRIL